jgi:Spy/CpxP family protein refolding chaperone
LIGDWGLRNFLRNILYLLIIGLSLGPPGFGLPAFSAAPEIQADDLELTPDQVQTMKTLNQQFHREQAQIRRKIMILRMELRTLNPEEVRGEEGEEIRREIQNLLIQIRERSLFYRQEAFLVLSPEQRKKISAETDLGFHCGEMFRRRGRRGMEMRGGGPATSK